MSVRDIVKPRFQPGINPATGELLTTVPHAGAGDADRAVKAARESFEKKTWRGKAGSVWINTSNGFDAGSPLGGYKQSGFGRDLGSYALDQYTNVKSVWIAL